MAPNTNPSDMVTFLMPDGNKVSNDPRFGMEEMRAELLASTPNRGDVGTPHEDQVAQTQVEKVASLQSGQPNVGDNATLDDPVRDAYGPLGSPAQQRQVEDVEKAQKAGASPNSTSVEDDEPVDSNEAVLKAREEREKRREKARRAAEKLGEEGPGDPDKPYSEWSPGQLKAEAFQRNADRGEEGQLDLSEVKNKGDLVRVLEADDELQSQGPPQS